MIRLAITNISQRKMRSSISIAALAVGISLYITLGGLVNGVLHEFTERIKGIGADITVIRSGTNPLLFGSGVLPYSLAEQLRGIDGVKTVSPVLIWKATIGSAPYNVFGIQPQNFSDLGGELNFLEGHNIEGKWEMFIDSRIANLEGYGVSDKIELLGHDFKIVGIVEPGVGTRIFVPYETLSEITAQDGRVSLYFVRAEDPSMVEPISRKIMESFKGVETQFMGNIASSMSGYLNALNQFISAINYTALVISALVILLSMYTTVVERTREIGILKSLGATRAYVLTTILFEAFVLSVLGALSGILLSLVTRIVIQHGFPLITVEISSRIVVNSLTLGILVGILGAVYPAYWASRQDPIKALVYE